MEHADWIKILISSMGLIIAFLLGGWYNKVNKVIAKNDATNHRQDTEIALNDAEITASTLRTKEAELKLNEGMLVLAKDMASYANRSIKTDMRVGQLESKIVFITDEVRGIRKDMNR